MELIKTKQSLSRSEIDSFSKKNDLVLPQDFINFYLKFNGGRPSHKYFKNYCLSFFIPIKYGLTENTIEYLIKELSEGDFLPQGYLPFANDSGGWYFCLDLNETNYGSVYVIRNDMADESPVFVAPNFKDFIENLSIEDNW